MRALIIGCGYVGTALGAELIRRGYDVFGLSRTAGSRPELTGLGIHPLEADITSLDSLLSVSNNWNWVINCVSSSRGSLEDYRKAYLEGTRNLLKWLSKSAPGKFLYTSSTSVYGQNNGSVVAETSPTEPKSETGKILVETEGLLLQAVEEQDFPAVILRVSGIYGPGRGYWLNRFVSAEAKSEGAGERILNMVHRDDVVGAIIAAAENGQVGKVYNVSDDEPVSQREVFKWLAQKLSESPAENFKPGGARAPVEGSPKAAHSAKIQNSPSVDRSQALFGTSRAPGSDGKRRTTNKRVSNARLKSELGYQLKYPTFREGFSASLTS